MSKQTDWSRRPKPPKSLLQIVPEYDFLPADDVEAWLRDTFLDPDSSLYNHEHVHLSEATIGVLWTSVANITKQREVVGRCEMPNIQGNQWLKARMAYQLRQWFGCVPDFVMTFYAPYANACSDAEWCALVEHEMYHAGQELDDFGMPKFKKDGSPKFGMRGHDVEEFVGVVRRYGLGATGPAMRELVEAANQEPEIDAIDIKQMCGTCLTR